MARGVSEIVTIRRRSEKDKMKVLLAESLVSSHSCITTALNPDDISRVIMKTMERIGNFYNNIFPELATPTKTLFGRKKSPLELAEKILEKRIDHTTDFEGNFWSTFSQQSALPWTYLFSASGYTPMPIASSRILPLRARGAAFSVAKVIAAAAMPTRRWPMKRRSCSNISWTAQALQPTSARKRKKIFEDGVDITRSTSLLKFMDT